VTIAAAWLVRIEALPERNLKLLGGRLSGGFLCSLVGIALTLVAYLDIWFWPAWPGYALAQGLFRGPFDWTELSYGIRAAAVVGLICFNVAFWAVVAWLLWQSWIIVSRSQWWTHR
jgi:hypothetical protein